MYSVRLLWPPRSLPEWPYVTAWTGRGPGLGQLGSVTAASPAGQSGTIMATTCRAAPATVATDTSLSVSSKSNCADRLATVAVVAVPGASFQSLVTESSYQGRD